MWRRYLWSFLYSHRHARDDADRQQLSLHPQMWVIKTELDELGLTQRSEEMATVE
jgi:hypothetical protein